MRLIKKTWKWLTRDSEWGGRIMLVLLIIAILFTAILLSGPKPENHMILPTPWPNQLELTPTPSSAIPPASGDYVQTTGVIVAASTIIVVIVTGTLIEIRRNNKEKQEDQDK